MIYFLPTLLEVLSGPFQFFEETILFPKWPGIGQYLPLRQRLHFSLLGTSTTLRSFPYFRLGIIHRK